MAIRHLKSDNFKSVGLDKISDVHVLKDIVNVITPSLMALMFPFKQDLFHLYGKPQRLYSCSCRGDKQDTSNYRLISILPMVSKILEKAVNAQHYAFLTENNLCSPNNFGFRLKSSIVAASSQLSDGCLSEAVFLDLPKETFDTVNHSILLQNLQVLVLTVLPGTGLPHF